MTSSIYSGAGNWNPFALLSAIFFIAILVYLIRAIGNKRYKKGTAQTKPFVSGNVEIPDIDPISSDIYWGLFQIFRPIYRPLMWLHTGVVNDYVGAFVAVLALLLIILLLV